MQEEFKTLSERKYAGFFYKEEDVKEFIKRLKEWLSEQDIDNLSSLTVHNQLDKLAGDKLDGNL